MKKIFVLVPMLALLVAGCSLTKKSVDNSSVLNQPVSLPQEQKQVSNEINSDCSPTTAPWIKVISPNGGEIYTIGQEITLKWKTCNISQTDHITAQLDAISNLNNSKSLFGEGDDEGLSSDIGSLNDGQQTINLGPISETGVQWINPGTYKLILSKFGTPSITDSSDNLFTIQESSVSNEDSSEKWVNTPAEIKSISVKNKTTFLSIDILSRNPKFVPGVTEFFINQSTKLREVSVNDNTKSYLCGAGPDGNDTTADVSVDTKNILAAIQKKLLNKEYSTYYFDINNNDVQAIYEQCLP